MPEQENDFKTLVERNIVQPVNRKFQSVDSRIAQLERSNASLRRCIWWLAAVAMLNLLMAAAALMLCRG